MGHFEGSLVKQAGFIQDNMHSAVEKLTAMMQKCDEVMRLSLHLQPYVTPPATLRNTPAALSSTACHPR